MAELAQIGVTGLAVMGRNLARNFARHGHRVAIHNRSYARTESLVAEAGSEGTFLPATTLTEFVASLEKPRRVLIMVKAGPGTDAVINELIPCWRKATSSSTPAMRTSRTRSAVKPNSSPTVCTSSAPAFPAVRRVR